MKVEFLNPSHPSRPLDQNQSALINLYLEQDQSYGRYDVFALPTPGFGTPFVTLAAGGVVRGLFEHNGTLYAVAGNKFYSITSTPTATERGTLNTSTGLVYFSGIVDYITIVDGTNGYTYRPSTTTFAEITDVDFPDNATSITDLDEYVIATLGGSNQFQISAVGNPTSWAAADIATITTNSNNIVRGIVNRHVLWFFGPFTTEIWFNSGATFPFERVEGTDIDWGLAAAGSLASGDNTLIFLGQSVNGGPAVVQMDSYKPNIISNPGINYEISTYATISDAVGFIYAQDGHAFYVITFPTAAKTWVYDLTTKVWHERQSNVSAAYTRWLPNCYAYNYDKHLIGAYNSGKVYDLDTATYQEDGTAIRRRLTTHPFTLNEKRYTIDKFQIVFQSAVAASPEFDLEVSRDGGRTFSTAITKNLGTTTDYGKRIMYDRLGQCRSCVFRVTSTMNAQFTILGAQADLRIQDMTVSENIAGGAK